MIAKKTLQKNENNDKNFGKTKPQNDTLSTPIIFSASINKVLSEKGDANILGSICLSKLKAEIAIISNVNIEGILCMVAI